MKEDNLMLPTNRLKLVVFFCVEKIVLMGSWFEAFCGLFFKKLQIFG
jgi:hypothetical protein